MGAIRTFEFGIHPGVSRIRKWEDDLPGTTGRNLQEWMDFIRVSGPKDDKACREWLKREYQFGVNTAWWLAERAAGRGWHDGDPEIYLQQAEEYVANMFSGPKVGLIPLYERVMEMAYAIGADVRACPCKTIVPLYRKHVFAEIKPATRKRIDLGFALGSRPAEGRLIDTGGFAKKDRLTHRIPLTSLEEVNAEVEQWLRAAYEGDK